MIKKEVWIAFLVILLITIVGCQKESGNSLSKIHPTLLSYLNSQEERVPSYLINEDSMWNVQIECYSKFEEENCTTDIGKYGEIIGPISKTLFKVKINRESLYELTKENEIQSIEGARAPVVDTENGNYCEEANDCELVFINCKCTYECLKKIDESRDDCTRDCLNKKTEPSTMCRCVNNKCSDLNRTCDDKISYNLKGEIPSWAINKDGSIKVTIACTNEEKCRQIISQYGEVTEQWSDRIYEANLLNVSIYALACESNIKFIERAMGTPQPTTN